MILETITLEAAVKAATPTAKKLFKSKILPLVETKFSEYFKTKASQNKLERSSVKYIAKLTGQCSTISTIAFQNSPKKLDELYIPLTITDGDEENDVLIDGNVNIFDLDNHVLVSDTAGMGKSTLSKKILLNIIKQEEYIPIYIELRQLKNEPIEKHICRNLGIEIETPIDLIRNSPFVYIFDGVDEIANELKKDVINNIVKFISEIDDSKVLITSRQESYLTEFYDFRRYTINPLNEGEAYSLISKCDPSGKIAKKLISGIKSSNEDGLKDFLRTPLYVSLLYCSYRYKTVIPQKKHLFYSQVYDALFESHDLSKEVGYVRPKHSKLDSAEFHSILRRFGFWCLRNSGKIEFQKDELEIIIEGIIQKKSGISTSAANFVKDLSSTVPLFVKEGSSLRWSHKSLMEYFASMFICNDAKIKQKEILMKLYKSDNWSSYINIFELCSDIDYSTFRASIVKKVLENFVCHSKENYQHITNSRISKNEINKRVGLTFSTETYFRLLTSQQMGDEVWEDGIKHARKIKSNNSTDTQKNSQIIFHFKESCLINAIHSTGRERVVLNIIRNRSPNLFISMDGESHFNTAETAENSSLKYNKLYVVNDNSNSLENNSKNFKIVNSILWICHRHALDIETVINELECLNRDLSDGIDDLLIDL